MTWKKNEVLCLIFQEDIFDFTIVTKQITKGCAKLRVSSRYLLSGLNNYISKLTKQEKTHSSHGICMENILLQKINQTLMLLFQLFPVSIVMELDIRSKNCELCAQ